VRGTTETGVKYPHTTTDELFSFTRYTFSIKVSFGYIPEKQVDESIIELSGNQKSHAFNAALTDEVAMYEYSARGLQNTRSLPTHLEVHLNSHLRKVYLFKQTNYSFGRPKDFEQAAGIIAFKSQYSTTISHLVTQSKVACIWII
jgi:hypothetical protein